MSRIISVLDLLCTAVSDASERKRNDLGQVGSSGY